MGRLLASLLAWNMPREIQIKQIDAFSEANVSSMLRDTVCISVIYQYLRHTSSTLTEEFESKYKPDKDMEVDVKKLLRDWREEQEEIKLIIYQYLRKTSSPNLAAEFRKTHLPAEQQKQQGGQNCLRETTFAKLIQVWQQMQQDTSKIVFIDVDESDDDDIILDDGDDDDVVILDDDDDDIVILDEDYVEILVDDEKHEESDRNEQKQLEASIVHQYLKLVSSELAVEFQETQCQCQLEMPVRLQDFAEQALKFHQPNDKENETGATSGQSEKRGSMLGIVSKRFTEEEIRKIHELMKELGQRSKLVGRRIWTEEEERKIEKVALEMNRFFN